MAEGTKRRMRLCSECNSVMLDYFDEKSGFTEFICWKCGRYESDSLSFKKTPELYINMVREEPAYFMKKYATNRGLTGRTDQSNSYQNRKYKCSCGQEFFSYKPLQEHQTHHNHTGFWEWHE